MKTPLIPPSITPILAAFASFAIDDIFLKKAILANIKKECGFIPGEENLNYSKTSNNRVRSIFGSRVASMTDEVLNALKKNPSEFAEAVYGKNTKIGIMMGNVDPGDGWKFRGRGYIQLTGRSNYDKFGRIAEVDLIACPDLLIIDKTVSAKVSVGFIMYGLKAREFKDQASADLAVTQVIGGRGLNLMSGYGAELLAKVNKYSSEFSLDA